MRTQNMVSIIHTKNAHPDISRPVPPWNLHLQVVLNLIYFSLLYYVLRTVKIIL